MKVKDIVDTLYPDTIVKVVIGYEPIICTHSKCLIEYSALMDCEIREIYLSAMDYNVLCLKINSTHPTTGIPIKKIDLVTGKIID